MSWPQQPKRVCWIQFPLIHFSDPMCFFSHSLFRRLCHNTNMFDRDDCVPYRQCGSVAYVRRMSNVHWADWAKRSCCRPLMSCCVRRRQAAVLGSSVIRQMVPGLFWRTGCLWAQGQPPNLHILRGQRLSLEPCLSCVPCDNVWTGVLCPSLTSWYQGSPCHLVETQINQRSKWDSHGPSLQNGQIVWSICKPYWPSTHTGQSGHAFSLTFLAGKWRPSQQYWELTDYSAYWKLYNIINYIFFFSGFYGRYWAILCLSMTWSYSKESQTRSMEPWPVSGGAEKRAPRAAGWLCIYAIQKNNMLFSYIYTRRTLKI